MRLLQIGSLIAILCTTAMPLAAQEALVDAVIERCTVSVKDELRLPAQDAGVLTELNVEEGDQVELGTLLGKTDDTEAAVAKIVAESALARAKKEADSEIRVNYAIWTAGQSEMEYRAALSANERAKQRGGSSSPYPLTEIKRLELSWKGANAQIDLSRMEKGMAAMDVSARTAELDGVTKALARRQFHAPFPAQVVKIYRRKGEWVQPGEPILQLMRFDTMTVNGLIDARKYDPSEIAGKNVTVQINMARGRVITLQGRVKYVSPVLLVGNKYAIEAEVPNREENGHWLVPDGASATMTIHVN